MTKRVTLHTDGGARGNPGPAGIGFVLVLPDKTEIAHGEYIGETTNNQAEYQALLAGLERALSLGVREIDCYLDSELVVKQLNGQYKVKHEDMKLLWSDVGDLKRKFSSISFTHVMRVKNKKADALVNKALDSFLG